MTALSFGEGIAGDDAPGFVGVVVLDRSLEMLAQRVGLAKLPAQPPEETDLGRPAHRLRAQICSLCSTLNPSRS
jgi:hypothetical protein